MSPRSNFHPPPRALSWLHGYLKGGLLVLMGTGEITASVRQTRTEELRELMLAEMGNTGIADFPEVARRVRYATDIQSLWYARGDVMQVLSAAHGASIARRKMRRISGGFKGLLPSGMNPRRSSIRF